MVEDAQADKAPIQRIADMVSNYFVPIVVVAALITFTLWYIVFTFTPPEGIHQFLFSFQADDCGAGDRLSVRSGSCHANSHHGRKRGWAQPGQFDSKGASVLENISKLDVILFDKTGTITIGKPEVVGVYPFGPHSEEEVLSIAASASFNSTHPLSQAIVSRARTAGCSPRMCESPGTERHGIQCSLNGDLLKVGSDKFVAVEKELAGSCSGSRSATCR